MTRVVTALNCAIGKAVTAGKVALITGGTSGIGAATARRNSPPGKIEEILCKAVG
jgi:hypothetical protein